MNTIRPNIFRNATSELSQDAFIAWLFEWANPNFADTSCENDDQQLHNLSIEFVRKIVGDPHFEVESIQVKRQHNHMDVFVVLNNRVAIIVEDKTWTTEHNYQLARYAKDVLHTSSFDKIYCVYYKTGIESLTKVHSIEKGFWENVENKDRVSFVSFNLTTLLGLFDSRQIFNPIFADYVTCLKDHKEKIEQYKSIPINQWDASCWQGFFQDIERVLPESDIWWGYVPNQSGGFQCLTFHKIELSKNPQILIKPQFECANSKDKLCIKIEGALDSQIIQRLVRQLDDFSKGTELPITTRFRKGHGQHVTIGKIEIPDLLSKNLIDIDTAVKKLKQVSTIIDDFVKYCNKNLA